jgi:NAD(P)-dependent dehydrogenase (short-subunit alcohol dehydrogenase family)
VSYVDLHCHLLPGVDDGAPTMEHSAAYAKRLRAEGVRDVLVTPHVNDIWPLDVLSIPERVAELSDELRRRGLALRLHAGGEVAHERAVELTDERSVEAGFEGISGLWGAVNCAGGWKGGSPVKDTPVEVLEAMLGSNLRSAFLVSRAALRRFGPRAGASSTSARWRAA